MSNEHGGSQISLEAIAAAAHSVMCVLLHTIPIYHAAVVYVWSLSQSTLALCVKITKICSILLHRHLQYIHMYVGELTWRIIPSQHKQKNYMARSKNQS